jgi:hypothetical protein
MLHSLVGCFKKNTFPGVYFSYLCTYDLYGPVRNVFDARRYNSRATKQ